MPKTDRLLKSGFYAGLILLLISLAACRQADEQQPAENLVELDSMAYRYPRYIYNVVNPNNDVKLNGDKQTEHFFRIRNKEPYKLLI